MITIKKCALEDAQALSMLHYACFEKGWREEEFAAFYHDPHIVLLGAYKNKNLIGFIIAHHASDQADMLSLAVAALERGQAIGQKLIHHLHQHLFIKGVKTVFLEVAYDHDALHLYQKMAYQKIGVRRNYYKRKEGFVDAHLMRYDFKDYAF